MPRSSAVSGTEARYIERRGKTPRGGSTRARGKKAQRKLPTSIPASEEPVYCIRAVGAAYPQPQVSAVGCGARRSRRRTRANPSATAASTAATVLTRTAEAPAEAAEAASASDGSPDQCAAARASPGRSAAGKRPMSTQTAASTSMGASMGAGAS